MTQKYRYYLDFGSGYQLVEIYNNSIVVRSEKKYSLVEETKTVSGSMEIYGQDAEDAFNLRDDNYYIPFKIEEYNGTSWNTLVESNADIRGEYLRKSKRLTINNFVEAETNASILAASLTKTFSTADLGVSTTNISVSITSTRLDITSGPTALTPTQYAAAFNIENQQVTTTDTRWNYFRWYTTTGSSPSWIHTWSARSFDYRPGSQDNQNGYTRIIYQSKGRWVEYPPATYSDSTFSANLMTETYRFDLFLDDVLSAIDSNFGFDYTDAGDWTITNTFYIGNGNDPSNDPIEGIEYNLESIFEFVRNYYNYDWYFDGNDLKFEYRPYIHYNSIQDWSDSFDNLDEIGFGYNPMPDRERFQLGDASLDRFLVSYFDKGINTDDNEINYRSELMHDFYTLLEGDLSKDKLVWIIYSSGTVTVNSLQTFFNSAGIYNSFCQYDRFIVPTDPSSSYSTIPKSASDTRPIYSIKHKRIIDDYSAFDLFTRITTGYGNGYINSYDLELNTNIATFDIWMPTLLGI
jgi:hypothetical protein